MSVVRDKDTGLSKCFGFVSMQASDGAKKALLKQVLKDFFSVIASYVTPRYTLWTIEP